MFPAFLKLNGADPSLVKWTDMTPPARIASLVLGQVDGVTLFFTEQPTFAAKAKEAGKHWKDFPYADFGLDLYSNGLLAREDLIANQPDRVKRWVEATMASRQLDGSRRQFLRKAGAATALAALPIAPRVHAQSKRPVTLRLDWLYQGPNAGFMGFARLL